MTKIISSFEPFSMADELIKDHRIHALGDGKNSELIHYDGSKGIYDSSVQGLRALAQIEYIVSQTDGWKVKEHHVNEIVAATRRNAPSLSAEKLNDPAKEIINFNNGVLNLQTWQLEKHSPNHYYTIGIPHNYVPDAKCPLFDKFLNEVLPPDHHTLMQQILGYLLIPSTRHRKVFILVGSGANGKSVFLTAVGALLGADNISAVPLHRLTTRFGLYPLHGKLANICADIDSADLKHSGLLKQVVGGDRVEYERKFHDPFVGKVSARLIFSTNDVPAIQDTSDAAQDRLILVEFPVRIKETDQDLDLASKLTEESELEGIIARHAVPGLKSLMKAGSFDIPARSRDLHDQYRSRVDPLREFFDDNVRAESGSRVQKSGVYERYMKFAASHGLRPLSQPEFNRKLAQRFGLDLWKDSREPVSRHRVWEGIELTETPMNPVSLNPRDFARGRIN